MMNMLSGCDDLAKQRMQQAQALSREVRGDRLNLGKKISVPKDLMMEELNLPSNRGSRMFQERQKRVEMFTLENPVNDTYSSNGFPEPQPPQFSPQPEPGKENQTYPIHGKHSLVTTLQKTVALKGSPAFLAPGYGGPLKEIPREKFNMTVIPKSYCSPWREALGGHQQRLDALSTQLPQPPQTLQPANYRCFNRAAIPFGGPMASRRVNPVVGFEASENQNLPSTTLEHLIRRPNFNRAPRGWGGQYSPESSDL
ncbi:myozenin-2 [Osmerus mordax]|uniref:myozenin-2 n=1 Tax=Osmerus mordax TaxID=8014 RepID=UPI00350EB97F